MAKFHFRLEALKKLRENRVLAARREVGRIQSELVLAQTQEDDVLNSRRSLLGILSDVETSMDNRLLYAGLVESETRRLKKILEHKQNLEQELERQMNWLTHVGRELKIVEKLEEKQLAEFKEREKQLEKRRVDGWVAERWARKEKISG